MPSKSPAQAQLMAAAAHTKGGYGGVPQSVGQEFNRADAGTGILRKHGLDSVKHYATGGTIKTGSFHGKSNEFGRGGRAAQLKAKGVPGGVIGAIARAKGAAPGGPNYHGHKFAKGGPVQPHLRMSPNHKHTPTPVPALANSMPETNIHGIPIRMPMSMNQSRR